MNKKNLSVVLAGAMLATTVAPVLAETTVSKEYTTEELALLKKEIKAKMEEEKTSKLDIFLKDAATDKDAKFVSTSVKSLMSKTDSAYGIKVVGKDGKDKDLTKLTNSKATNAVTTYKSKVDNNAVFNLADIDAVLNESNIAELTGCTIQLVKLKTTTFKGQVIPGKEITKVEDSESNYEPRADFISGDASTKLATDKGIGKEVNDVASDNKFVGTVEGVGKTYDVSTGKEDADFTTGHYYKEVKLTTEVPNNVADATEGTVEIYLDVTKKKLDFSLPLNDKDELLDYKKEVGMNKFARFEAAGEWEISKEFEEAPEDVASYKINAVESNENLFKAEELYDGIALTAKGTELAIALENAYENAALNDKSDALVKISAKPGTAAGINKFSIYYYKNEEDAKKDTTPNGTGAYKTITVYSSNFNEIKALHDLLNPKVDASYKVGIVAGDNRYATAVKIADANKAELKIVEAKGSDNDIFNNNIVIVNGESLVDGLAAAPLAAGLNHVGKNKGTSLKQAPVLLSKTDSLPKETKDFIETLAKKYDKKARKAYTINLVGGKSVLSEKLVAELEDMGFTVKRFGGDNRESTSLKVAEALKAAGNKNNAFVVGGNGEADAMAISAIAAKTKTPIIVSSVHGLSNKALTYINENSSKGDITIVGGTSVVSEEDEKALNDSLTLNKASRIAGENRFETNAAIIKKYYTGASASNAKAIILAKDGAAKKSELVDALAAANFAAKNDAPIVLATSSLDAEQKNELLKVKKDADVKLIQVGEGVERPVLEGLAKLFGLSNF